MDDLHMGMLSRHMTTWILEIAVNVLEIPALTIQSYALQVRPKLDSISKLKACRAGVTIPEKVLEDKNASECLNSNVT